MLHTCDDVRRGALQRWRAPCIRVYSLPCLLRDVVLLISISPPDSPPSHMSFSHGNLRAIGMLFLLFSFVHTVPPSSLPHLPSHDILFISIYMYVSLFSWLLFLLCLLRACIRHSPLYVFCHIACKRHLCNTKTARRCSYHAVGVALRAAARISS